MAKMIRLDFRKAPPSSGGGTDRIPAGRYLLMVTKTSEPEATSKAGKPMITVNFKVARGDKTGKRLTDYFVIPETSDDSLVGLQRLHAMIRACGIVPPTTGAFRFDLEMLVGKSCWCEVIDNELAGRPGQSSRTISRPDEYLMGPQGEMDASEEAEDDEDDDDLEAEDEETLGFEDDDDDAEYDDDVEADDADDDDLPEIAPPPPPPVPERRRQAAPVAEAQTPAPARRRAAAAPEPVVGSPPAAASANGTRPRRRPAPPADDSAFPFAQ